MTKSYNHDEVETAVCLWEALEDAERKSIVTLPWAAIRENYGTTALRNNIIMLASLCSKDWRDNDGPNVSPVQQKYPAFDWDFCPKWLEDCVDWENVIPGCHAQAKSDALRMAALGLPKPSDNLTSADTGERVKRKPIPRPAPAPIPPTPTQFVPTCPVCHSEDVTAGTCSRWDRDNNQWVAKEAHDGDGHCYACGNSEFQIKLHPITQHKVLLRRVYEVAAYKVIDVMAPNRTIAEAIVNNDGAQFNEPSTAYDPGDGWKMAWERQAGVTSAAYRE